MDPILLEIWIGHQFPQTVVIIQENNYTYIVIFIKYLSKSNKTRKFLKFKQTSYLSSNFIFF